MTFKFYFRLINRKGRHAFGGRAKKAQSAPGKEIIIFIRIAILLISFIIEKYRQYFPVY
jgi:hypothetical protein